MIMESVPKEEVHLNKLCRTCLSTDDPFLNFFNFHEVCTNTKTSFADMLLSVAYIQISSGDGLPDDLCEQCAEKTTMAYNFKILCERSDAVLRKSQFQQFDNVLQEPILSTNSLLLVRPQTIMPIPAIPIITMPEENILTRKSSDFESVIDEGIDLFNDKSVLVKKKSIRKKKKDDNGKIETEKNTIMDYHEDFANPIYGNQEFSCSIWENPVDYTPETVKNNSSTVKFHCQLCGKSFARIYTLHHHLITHTDYKAHLCPVCGKQFHLPGGLRQHLKYHQGNKQHSCDICKKNYYNQHLLREHVRCAHSNNRYNYACTICNKKFTAKSTLNMHMKVHTGEKPHACETCGKRFTRAAYLKAHSRNHTQEPPPRVFLCSYDNCGRMYTTKAALDIHIRHRHTRERPFVCETCEKSFCSQTGLTEHRKVHTGEKPEECMLCGKHFVNKQSLKKHTRLHTGDKPYPCSHCDERFLSSSRRNEHIQTKHMERQEECPICNKRFHLRRTLKSHLRVHSGEKRTQADALPQLANSDIPANLDPKQNVPEPGFEVIV